MLETIKNIFRRKRLINEDIFNTTVLNWVQANFLLQIGKEIIGFKVDLEICNNSLIFAIKGIDDHYAIRYFAQNSKEIDRTVEFGENGLPIIEEMINDIKKEFQNTKFRLGIIKAE